MIRKIIHPLLLTAVSIKYRRIHIKKYGFDISNIGQPVIFVANHSNGYDFPTISRVIKKHFFILADHTMKNDFVVNILNQLNGCVYVDRNDKASRNISRQSLIDLLKHRNNILLFPEGTWNLRPAELLLPLNWGVIGISNELKIPIIPLGVIYSQNNAYVEIGNPYYPTDNLAYEINVLKDIMATLLWKNISKTSLESHDYIKSLDYKQEQLKTYTKLDLQLESSVIRTEYTNSRDVFSHLNYIQSNHNTAFLFSKRNHN